MYKLFLGFALGSLTFSAVSTAYPEGTALFMKGMTYCKDNPTVCDKYYESVLLERESERVREESKQLRFSANNK